MTEEFEQYESALKVIEGHYSGPAHTLRKAVRALKEARVNLAPPEAPAPKAEPVAVVEPKPAPKAKSSRWK